MTDSAPSAAVRILVVEDSTSIARTLEYRLGRLAGYDLATATDFAQTRELLRQQKTPFDLAILDLLLPDAPDGEVVDHVRAQGIPCVVFTSTPSADARASILGKGVVDYVLKGPRAAETLERTVRRVLANRGVHVLVVDDSPSFRGVMETILGHQMYRVHSATCGEEALEIVEGRGGMDAVVTDHEMPGISGVELTAKLRAGYARDEMAIIGVSSMRSQRLLSTAFLKAGADDFLHKPFETEEFQARLLVNVERLEQVRRLRELGEAKNRFLGMAAHDIRSPLSGVLSVAEVMLGQEPGPLNPAQRELMRLSRDACGKIMALVGDLLDVTAIEQGRLDLNLRAAPLAPLVREQVRLHRVIASRKNIQVEVDALADVTVPMDAARIGQVLANLLDNAIKFSLPGTRVRVGASMGKERVSVWVADQGPGIGEEDQKRLFGHFQRLSNAPTGGEPSTGLGLAICRKVVEMHGGQISVESERGQGATFTLTLPMR